MSVHFDRHLLTAFPVTRPYCLKLSAVNPFDQATQKHIAN